MGEGETILLDIEDGVAVVTLNRPDKLNAMQAPMMEILLRTVGDLADDPKVGCVVLTGAGRGFCGGGDLAGKAAEVAAEALLHPSLRKRPQTITGRIDWLDHIQRTAVILHDMPKPTIAMVNGPCAGAGLAIAGACDLRLAGASAMFTTAFARVGTSGDYGGSYFWTKILGAAKARELYLLSERIGAEQALAWGMVNRVHPDAELRERTMEVARALAAGPTYAYGLIKRNIALAEHAPMADVMRMEVIAQNICTLEIQERKKLAEDAQRLPLP